MLSALLYFATALGILGVTRRWIARFTRASAIALLLLPILFTGRALLTGRLMAPVDIPYQTEPLYGLRAAQHIGDPYDANLMDIACQMIPWRAALREALAHGQWPLFNRHILAGDALAGAAQPAAYSPFTLLALIAQPAESFNFTGSIALFVALLGGFLFALEVGVSELGALFGAIAYGFCGPMVFAMLWPLGFAWALLPFVMFAIERRSIPLLTIALTLEILAGHPESVLHVVLLAGLWWLLRGARDVKRVVIAGVLAAGLTAIYTLPVIDHADQSEQHHFRLTVFAKSSRVAPLREIGAGVLTTLFPHLDQQKWIVPMRTPAFIGIGSLVLAAMLTALVRVRSRIIWLLLGLFVFCACAAFQVAPISSLLHALPLFNVVLNERLLLGASFFAAMLAAIGIERFQRAWTFPAMFLFVMAGEIIIPHLHFTDGQTSAFRMHAANGELLPLMAAAILVWWFREARQALPIFIALLLIQRFATDGRWFPTLPRDAAAPRITLLDHVHDGRVTARGQLFLPNISALYGVDDVRGYEALTFRPFVETYPLWCTQIPIWFNRIDDLSAPMLSMLNVRYAIVKESDDDIPAGWREAAREPGVAKLVENERVLPRMFVPRNVRVGTPAELVIPEMRGETDFGERAWIDVPGVSAHEEVNGPGSCEESQRGVATVLMQRPGWVVISNAALRGWRAYVDDKRSHIARANHAFIAVHVPEGRHTLRLEFLPRSFVVGRAISVITLLLIGIAVVRRVFIRRVGWSG